MSERQLQITRGILKLSFVEVGSVYHWPMTWPKTKTLTNSRLPVGKGLCWRWRARLQAGIELGSVNTPSLGGVAFHVVAICQPLSWAGRLSPESGYICNVISPRADSLHFVKMHCVTIFRTVREVAVPRCDSNECHARKDKFKD